MMNKAHPHLPKPDASAQAQSLCLSQQIAQEIAQQQGWISFAHFMERALYAPGLGYYSSASKKIGAQVNDGSDFTTAPQLSPLFAQTLAQPVKQALQLTQTDQILEFGAGTGRLAAGLLNALADHVQRYVIIELSADLRLEQQQTLQQLVPEYANRVQWLDQLPDAFEGVVIGNEVLDAMPVQLFVHQDQGHWLERGVTWREEAFHFADRPIAQATVMPWLSKIQVAPGYVTELHLAAHAFVKTLFNVLRKGVVFFIDYGFAWSEYYHAQRHQGTLMCHYRHYAHADPFFYPGLQDITAHVEFSGIYQQALQAGAQLLGFTSQANLLLNSGLLDQLSQLNTDAATFLPVSQAVHYLVAESEMGELFKVMALSQGVGEIHLDAFARGDRSYAL